MAPSQKSKKSIKRRSKCLFKRREPKLQNSKSTLVLNNTASGIVVEACLKTLVKFKTDKIFLKRRSNKSLFENYEDVEKLSRQHGCSMFLVGSDTKKRPNNIIIGRIYDEKVFDMFEMGIAHLDFDSDFMNKLTYGSKMGLLFLGEFTISTEMQRLKNFFIDYFGGPVVDNIVVTGFDNYLMFVLYENELEIRNYKTTVKNCSGTYSIADCQFVSSIKFKLRRNQIASEKEFKNSLSLPTIIRKKKNIEMDVFSNKLGRVHMSRQNMDEMKNPPFHFQIMSNRSLWMEAGRLEFCVSRRCFIRELKKNEPEMKALIEANKIFDSKYNARLSNRFNTTNYTSQW
ncbi:Ribosome biogenesis protein RPF2 [Intoshia linei]|uniref:Ribosome production factor 2 homolog n=1 Tax=Intoshia linei TaxID=1819745 RepID=A0A177BBC1_9BILA|nr:Ribosome biogenesis protein RPF2 [Intoshia linei]